MGRNVGRTRFYEVLPGSLNLREPGFSEKLGEKLF